MKITVDYNEIKEELLSIENAKYIGDFAIRLNFSNNKKILVDFKSFLNNSQHPSIKKYYNEQVFQQFKIKNGNLNWNDYDLIFPIEDLYNNSLIS